MIRLLAILFFSGLLITACRSAKNIQSAITKKDSVAVVAVVEEKFDSLKFIREAYGQLYSNRINYNTFSAKINVDYQGSDGKKYDVTVFVRMKKDSIIWLSVNGLLGIEGMRVMVEKDSVRILDKLEKVYEVKAMNYLQDVTSLPLNLASMQDLLIGNPVFLDTNFISFTHANNIISILSQGEWFKHLITMQDNDHLVINSKLDDMDMNKNRTAHLHYTGYENKKGVNFSTSRNISIVEKTRLDIKLNYKQYEFNEMLSFPFSVPKNYKIN